MDKGQIYLQYAYFIAYTVKAVYFIDPIVKA